MLRLPQERIARVDLVESAWLQLRLSVHDPVMPLNLESDVPGGVKYMLRELLKLLAEFEELDLSPIQMALIDK